jgi:prophage antirepressor-like protein
MDSVYAPPGYLTARQVAQLLGIAPDSVRQLVRRGQLKRSGGSPRQPWFAARDVAALHVARRARAAA